MIKILSLALLLLALPVMVSAEEDVMQSTLSNALQELDQAWARLGKPPYADEETLRRVQKESKDRIFRLVWGKRGLGVTTNLLPGNIRVNVDYEGRKASADWKPGGSK